MQPRVVAIEADTFQFHSGLIKSGLKAFDINYFTSFNSILVWLKGVVIWQKLRIPNMFQFHSGLIKRHLKLRLQVLFFPVSIPFWSD